METMSDKKIQKIIKRTIDIVLAPIILICASPLFVIAMIVVKINSPESPLIFKQMRSGYKSKLFIMYKLRTMTNEKNVDGELLPDAQRLKLWGKIIRKTGLDEIPQMINILRGEMSLIGPRPILPSYVEKFDDYQLRRQDVMPGISGWQTVNEWKTPTWEKTFEYDIYYVDNFSLWLDIKIFLKTIYMVVFMNRTAEDYRPTFDEYYKAK